MAMEPWRLRKVGPTPGGRQPGSPRGQKQGDPTARYSLSPGRWAPRACGPVCADLPSLAFKVSSNLVEHLRASHRLPLASVSLSILGSLVWMACPIWELQTLPGTCV